MQFTIGKSTVSFDIKEGQDYEEVAQALLSDETVKAELKEHAASFYFRAWDRDGGLDQSTVNTVIGKALDEGVDAAVNYMLENDFDQEALLYYHHSNGKESTSTFLNGFLTGYAAAADLDDDEIEAFEEAVLDAVGEWVAEEMAEADKSQPHEIFASHDKVRVAFIQGYGTAGYMDDIHTSHADVTCQSDTVKPDRNLMLQFKLLNVSPVEFVEYYKAKTGYDLCNPEFGDEVSEYRRGQYTENAQAWRFACAVYRGEDVSELEIPDWLSHGNRSQDMADVIRSCRDLDRPSAVSLETMETILDNATYGGVATWYGRVSAKEIMQGQFENSFVARGGLIGVHDFINGSGYIDTAQNPVLIDMRDGKLVGDASYRYNPEEVYGFVQRSLDAETVGCQVGDWVRFSENSWRCAANDEGIHAEIVRTGEFTFSISTKDRMNGAAGQLDNNVVAGTLEDAMEEASSHLADQSPTVASTPAPRM
jgi:hypothetical protein